MGDIADFFEENDHALRHPQIVLRDSLGCLAIQILASRKNLSQIPYESMFDELYQIIEDLHHAYHDKYN